VELAVIPGDLAFQALDDLVHGRFDVPAAPDGPVGPTRCGARNLHPPTTIDARAGVLDHLDFHANGLGGQAGDLAQFVLDRSSDLVGDPGASSLQDEIHCLPLYPIGGTVAKGVLRPG
jgi:hypothetical protein